MANRNSAGFGLVEAMRVGNTPSIKGQSKYEIDAGESNAIFHGEPVKVDISTSTGGYIVTAAAGTAMVGVLNGVVYTDATTKKPTFMNFYPAATTPANSEDITAFVNDEPFQEYIIATDATLGGTLALRKSKINAVGVVGLVENMVSGNAQRPGDIVKSYSGKTIEVLNTDAEGRLVLADALTFTEKKFKPQFIVDLATLTGAIIVSLGSEYAGLFSNNDKLSKQLIDAGESVEEKL